MVKALGQSRAPHIRWWHFQEHLVLLAKFNFCRRAWKVAPHNVLSEENNETDSYYSRFSFFITNSSLSLKPSRNAWICEWREWMLITHPYFVFLTELVHQTAKNDQLLAMFSMPTLFVLWVPPHFNVRHIYTVSYLYHDTSSSLRHLSKATRSAHIAVSRFARSTNSEVVDDHTLFRTLNTFVAWTRWRKLSFCWCQNKAD